jgi:hypothetical protein
LIEKEVLFPRLGDSGVTSGFSKLY